MCVCVLFVRVLLSLNEPIGLEGEGLGFSMRVGTRDQAASSSMTTTTTTINYKNALILANLIVSSYMLKQSDPNF